MKNDIWVRSANGKNAHGYSIADTEKLCFEGEEITLEELKEAIELIRNKEKSYPVIHALWIDEGEDENDPNSGNHLYRCSNCYHSDLQAETTEVPYCWFCGARMDEVADNE